MGRGCRHWVKVGKINTNIITADIQIDNVDFYVVPKDTISFNCLLGRDFMNRSDLSISFAGNTVTVKSCKGADNFSEASKEIMAINYIEPHETNGIRIGQDVTPDVRNRVQDLFQGKYIKPVRPCKPETNFEMTIRVQPNHTPFFYRPRRLSFADKEKVNEITNELLESGVIRKSTSQYSSPLVLVRKKSGDFRLCIDFRTLNKITLRDNYPLPMIEDQLLHLRDKRYFTSLDLKSAFHHVTVSKDSVQFTSFVTPMGQYEYLKMPYGLKNSPPVFMRYINSIFQNLLEQDKVLIYIDDILIATKTIEENLDTLGKVLDLLVRNKLSLRLDKCSFLMSRIVYLGYDVTSDGISPSKEHIKAIESYPVPGNIKQLHSFIGLASYFRKFIPNFACVAKPLYDLLRKDAVFSFDERHFESFNRIKELLIKQPVLSIYSPKLETQLHCDASSLGYGAVLVQKQHDSKFHPVLYFSQRTTKVESKYHSFELEMLAIVNALNRFRVYLQGICFTIVTDCNSLKLALQKKDINPRILRWSLILQGYDYNLEHRDHTRMRHVDALSRCHLLVIQETSLEDNLYIKQNQDPDIIALRKTLESSEHKFFELRNGVVFRKFDNKLLLYVPSSMRSNIIKLCHEQHGHVGVDKTLEVIRRSFWFPEMKRTVKDSLANCLKCVIYNSKSGKKEGFLHSIPKGNLPFDTVHIDHCGPLEKTPKNFKYLFSIIDGFTKFIKIYPCKTTNSDEAIKHLQHYFTSYSKPKRVVSDRGTAFTSNKFKDFLFELNVDHHLIAVGAPRANGQIERYHRIIIPMVAKLTKDTSKWDQVLSTVEFSINNTVNRATGEMPAKLLFGINQRGSISEDFKELISEVAEDRDLEAIRTNAASNILKSQDYNNQLYNARSKDPVKYKIGDYVMITNTEVTPGVNKKLLPKFKGPYKVKRVLDNDRYLIEDVDGFQLSQKPFESVFDASHMKLWPY